MSQIRYAKYQVEGENSPLLGKWLMRAKHTETLNLKQLARHITEHNSVYGFDVVQGVLLKVSECMVELLSDGKKVKLDGLGTFYMNLKCKAADKPEKLTANSVERVYIRFKPDASSDVALDSKSVRRKVSLVEDNDYTSPDTETEGNGGDGSTNP